MENNIDNNKPCRNVLSYTVVFYDEPPEENTFGSNRISYQIFWDDKGIMQIIEIGAFGDGTLVAQYNDRRGRGITLDEMLENIKEISEMTYKEFKEKVLKENTDVK